MPTPPRRSARLQSNSTPEARKITPITALKLGSLMERDETPENGPQSTLDTIVSTPARSSIAVKDPPSQFTFSVKTPSTAGQPQPEHEEMHPSKAQQSTMKKPDSGLRLGFTSVNNSPRVNEGSLVTNTPSKVKGGLTNDMSSQEFKFTRPESQLSQEAQRLMEGLREEASRIKEQMAFEREEQARKDGEAEELFSAVGRKIAKPKGRAGRFSDIHMAEFKKMDSIAGHASAYRSKPAQVQQPAKSLKRTQSRAGLDDVDKQVPALKKAQVYQPPATNISDPPKRVRQAQSEDASTSRPSTSDRNSLFKPDLPRSQSGLMTPTKASLARSASVRSLKTTNIPALARSPSTKAVAAPSTVGGSRYKSFLPTAAANLKSILRRHQPRFSNDPAKIAAGTHLASPDLHKDLPDAPKSDFDEFYPPSSIKKHVGFTSSTNNRHSIMPGALPHSPKETGEDCRSATQPSKTSVTYPTLPDTASSPFKSSGGNRIFAKMASPTIRRVRPSNIGTEPVTSDTRTSFTFTAFSPSPQRVSNTGSRSHSLAEFPSVPQGMLNTSHRGHSLADFPSVPHGMPNKKRRRQSDEENEDTRRTPEPSEEPTMKRVKRAATAEPTPVQKSAAKSRIPRREAAANRPKGKSILSLSRLNMLARPKERK